MNKIEFKITKTDKKTKSSKEFKYINNYNVMLFIDNKQIEPIIGIDVFESKNNPNINYYLKPDKFLQTPEMASKNTSSLQYASSIEDGMKTLINRVIINHLEYALNNGYVYNKNWFS